MPQAERSERKKPTQATLKAHVKRGGTTRTALQAFGGNAQNLCTMVARAAEAVTWPEITLPEECVKLHIYRFQFLLYLCNLVSRHALLQSLRSLERNSRTFLFSIAILTGHHVENFVREFDLGSRVLWSMLVLCPEQPLKMLVLVCICRLYFISGWRTEKFCGRARNLADCSAECLVRVAAAIGPGKVSDMPYHVFGYGIALRQSFHEAELTKVGAKKTPPPPPPSK